MTHSLERLAGWAGDGSDFFPGSVSISVKLVTRKHSTPVHVCWADQLTWRITASRFTISCWLLSTFQCVIGLLLHSSPWCASTKNKLILISVSTRLAKNANGRHCIANITFELSLWTSGLIQKHIKKIMSYPWEVWGRQRIPQTTYYLAYNNILSFFLFRGIRFSRLNATCSSHYQTQITKYFHEYVKKIPFDICLSFTHPPVQLPIYHFFPHLPVVINECPVYRDTKVGFCFVLSSDWIEKWVFPAPVKGTFGLNTKNVIMYYNLQETFPCKSSYYKDILK